MIIFTHIHKKATLAGQPIFLYHETSPAATQEVDENRTAMVEVARPVNKLVKCIKEITSVCTPLKGEGAREVHTVPYASCAPTYLALF
jgi:hypothetical protein